MIRDDTRSDRVLVIGLISSGSMLLGLGLVGMAERGMGGDWLFGLGQLLWVCVAFYLVFQSGSILRE